LALVSCAVPVPGIDWDLAFVAVLVVQLSDFPLWQLLKNISYTFCIRLDMSPQLMPISYALSTIFAVLAHILRPFLS
jgi:hypothetical protein